MPTAFTESLPMAPQVPPRKRWTREECAALEGLPEFEGQSFELVQGELIDKMGKKRPHVNSITYLVAWFTNVFGVGFVNWECPIDVAPEDNPTNEPEPDVIVLRQETSNYVGNPRPEDLHLVIEISDTSLPFDLKTKAALYARAGIVEYWIIDVSAKRLIVHRNPQGGSYLFVVAYEQDENVAPLASQDHPFPVRNAFRA